MKMNYKGRFSPGDKKRKDIREDQRSAIKKG